MSLSLGKMASRSPITGVIETFGNCFRFKFPFRVFLLYFSSTLRCRPWFVCARTSCAEGVEPACSSNTACFSLISHCLWVLLDQTGSSRSVTVPEDRGGSPRALWHEHPVLAERAFPGHRSFTQSQRRCSVQDFSGPSSCVPVCAVEERGIS